VSSATQRRRTPGKPSSSLSAAIFLNADNTKCVFDSSASVTGFQWMQDAIYVDKVAPQPADLQKTAQNKLV